MKKEQVDQTIGRIEERIRKSDSLDGEKKSELLSLIGELRGEVTGLAETHGEDADSIASFTESSVREAIRSEKNPEVLEMSVDTMRLAARRFEVSHPTLVGLINNIGQTLWKIGI